jgi:hypothetical protein
VNETAHFVNEGFGWECKRCREHAPRAGEESSSALARFFREGEAEGGAPRLSTPSRARWKDETRTALRCPACGVEDDLKAQDDLKG